MSQNPAVLSLVLHLQEQAQQVPSSAPEPARVNLSLGGDRSLHCPVSSCQGCRNHSCGCGGDTCAVISADFN